MEGRFLAILALFVTLSVVSATPLQNNIYEPNYSDNIPKCFQPAVSGRCLAYFPSYHYNAQKKTCEQFIYGGCGGNQNRFLTIAECLLACEGAELEEHEFKLVLPSESIDICSMPSETGPCKASMSRFYYSGDHCESFVFGGCQGNENNFKTIEECQERCGRKSSEENEDVEPASENKSEEASEEQPNSDTIEKIE